MRVMIMGDSWSVGAWHGSNQDLQLASRQDAKRLYRKVKSQGYHGQTNNLYHRGIQHFLESRGHQVDHMGEAGSTNSAQLRRLIGHSDPDHDLIVWLWTDSVRDYEWYRNHQQGVHNLYDLHRNQETWCQNQIDAWQPAVWNRLIIVGGNAPLYTDWPCVHMRSWCEAMGYIKQDHPQVNPVNWRDFVNFCNGTLTRGRENEGDYVRYHRWWQWIRSFSHEHKQHHMDFLAESTARTKLLVYGDQNDQLGKGMMGDDLHPNVEAHEWLTQWVLQTHGSK